jgi:hypothetical protein
MNTMVDVRLTQTRMSYTSFAMLGAPPAALSVVGPEVSARPVASGPHSIDDGRQQAGHGLQEPAPATLGEQCDHWSVLLAAQLL